MSNPEKHPIADAGVEHDKPENVPSPQKEPSKSATGNTQKHENGREIPTDVMPDREEL